MDGWMNEWKWKKYFVNREDIFCQLPGLRADLRDFWKLRAENNNNNNNKRFFLYLDRPPLFSF